ncbi:MAG TPA: rod shape-determining protein MreD [Gaiellaceae bacterium]|jgi:rod shape-determining protein MreD|nr:rod shape-determining protein MreD [Gaiellaceae bacterium]
MTAALDALKIGVVVFAAAVVQVSVVAPAQVLGGTADLLLVTLVAVALLRGAAVGATAGFFGGLVADLATWETLGLTSLLLTIAGYWIGRYGETTGRDRAHAPLLSVVVVTILHALGSILLHTVLGTPVSVGYALGTTLLPTIVLNVLLTVPVYALCRRLLPPLERPDRAREVNLLG